MTEFCLVTRPWVRCATKDYATAELSITDVIARAHELRGFANESPLVDAALLRLLLVVLHRCFGPGDDKAWRWLWRRGSFDVAPVEAYLTQWRDQFDLFHAETPFFQVANLVEQSPNYERGKKPAREMIAEQSSYGGARELFESRSDGTTSITADAAARWLVAIQAFNTGGLLTRDVANGDPTSVQAASLCSSAVVTVRGDSLFETLLLNLLPYPNSNIFPTYAEDAPAWERPMRAKFQRRACRGWLDWLTWQSRRIQLFNDEEGRICSFILLGGTELVAEAPTLDPMCAYRKHEKHGLLPIRFSEERALWRDFGALFQIQSDNHSRSARVVSELTSRRLERSRCLQLQIYGQVPNKACIVLTRCETVPLPQELLQQPELISIIREQLANAEEAQQALRVALFIALQNVLSVGERTPGTKDTVGLLDNTQAVPRFWATMKPAFDRLLLTLAENPEHAASAFRVSLHATALETFERGVLSSSRNSRTLKGFAQGRAKLSRDLAAQGLGRRTLTEQTLNQAENAR